MSPLPKKRAMISHYFVTAAFDPSDPDNMAFTHITGQAVSLGQ